MAKQNYKSNLKHISQLCIENDGNLQKSIEKYFACSVSPKALKNFKEIAYCPHAKEIYLGDKDKTGCFIRCDYRKFPFSRMTKRGHFRADYLGMFFGGC